MTENTTGENLAAPHELAGLIEYQPGSVVSRTIIKKETGTVTIFAFDKGEGLSEHTAPFEAMVCGVEGEAQITLSGSPHVIKGGDMIIFPVGEPHSVLAVSQFKMMLIMIKS